MFHLGHNRTNLVIFITQQSHVRNVNTFSHLISVIVKKKKINRLFLILGNLSANRPYLPLFNKLLSGVFVTCVSWPQYTVLQGLSLPGVICSVQGGGSEDLRGERSRGRSLLKNTASPKDECQGNRGAARYWASRHFYCQLREVFISCVWNEIRAFSHHESGPCFYFGRAWWFRAWALKQPLFSGFLHTSELIQTKRDDLIF